MQWLKDLALSLLWHRFDPWPGNFHVLWAWPKKFKHVHESLKVSWAPNTIPVMPNGLVGL